MEKLDITITKKVTKNVGNYSSISPSVTITFKDVSIKDLEGLHDLSDELTTAMLLLETASLMGFIERDFRKEDYEHIVPEAEKERAEAIEKLKSLLE
jgi:hypothetical protein